jgi:uncharacterized protein (TIGR02246 family)
VDLSGAGVVEKWTNAVAEGDVDAIAKLYAPDASMIGTLGKVVPTKLEQIRQYFEVALKAFDVPRSVTLDSSEVLMVDDNTVVVTGFDTIKGSREGQQTISKGRVTFVIARRAADWMIVHLHRSPLPEA